MKPLYCGHHWDIPKCPDKELSSFQRYMHYTVGTFGTPQNVLMIEVFLFQSTVHYYYHFLINITGTTCKGCYCNQNTNSINYITDNSNCVLKRTLDAIQTSTTNSSTTNTIYSVYTIHVYYTILLLYNTNHCNKEDTVKPLYSSALWTSKSGWIGFQGWFLM